MKLTDYYRTKSAIILVLDDQLALWILGYVFTYGPTSLAELVNAIELGDSPEFYQSIGRLFTAKLLEYEVGMLKTTNEGNNIMGMVGLSNQHTPPKSKVQPFSSQVHVAPNNFITNNSNKVLKDRISKLIGFSKELKFLVGFFYFSGIRELYDAIRNNPDVVTRVLVGLNVDKQVYGLNEYGATGKLDGNKHQLLFKDSIIKSLNSDEFDTKEFYEQSKFFIQAIVDNKLIIKKTREPNHAKLYFFKMKDEHLDLKPCCFIYRQQ